MDTSIINNSQIFTDTFTDSITKNSKPNPSFIKELKSSDFNIFLKSGLGDTGGLQNKNKFIKMLAPDGKMAIPDQETFIPGKNQEVLPKSLILQQYKTYKEDQLLSNPGGDDFFLDKTKGVINNDYDHSNFMKRVGKDLSDAGGNFFNAVKDLGLGSKFKYVSKNGEIREARKLGFVKTLSNFFKNVASGLTFGAYTPEGEAKPVGGISKIKHMFNKIFKEAILGNIVKGVPGSMINVGEDLMFAGLNTIEAIPDATIGNFKPGRKAVTKVFDNAQVVLDYATDALPGGEAFARTRSVKLSKGIKGLPIINNITTSEDKGDGPKWKYVRNTRFRKIIETIVSLIPLRF